MPLYMIQDGVYNLCVMLAEIYMAVFDSRYIAYDIVSCVEHVAVMLTCWTIAAASKMPLDCNYEAIIL